MAVKSLGTKTYQDGPVSNWLKWEEGDRRAREVVTLADPATGLGDTLTYPSGTVLGTVTGSGEYAPHNPAAGDGTEVASGILLYENEITDGANLADVVIVVREANVRAAGLNYYNAVTTVEQTAAETALSAQGILMRASA